MVRESFLKLLQLCVQQQEAKSSVNTGVAGSEKMAEASLFLVLLLERPVLGTLFFSVYSLGLCEKERNVDLRGASSRLSLASMLRSCQSCPGSKTQLNLMCLMAYFCPLRHMRKNCGLLPHKFSCDTHAQDSVMCQDQAGIFRHGLNCIPPKFIF